MELYLVLGTEFSVFGAYYFLDRILKPDFSENVINRAGGWNCIVLAVICTSFFSLSETVQILFSKKNEAASLFLYEFLRLGYSLKI